MLEAAVCGAIELYGIKQRGFSIIDSNLIDINRLEIILEAPLSMIAT